MSCLEEFLGRFEFSTNSAPLVRFVGRSLFANAFKEEPIAAIVRFCVLFASEDPLWILGGC